jgi:hypothetical protein
MPAALAPAAAAPATGTVVVVIEEGYVAHRVETSLSVGLSDDDVHVFGEGSDEERALSAERIGGRWSGMHAHGGGAWGEGEWAGGSGDFGYLLQVALPAYRRSYTPFLTPAGVRAGTATASFAYAADLSDAAEGDFSRDRVKLLARAVARAGTKYALAELASRKKKAEADEEESDDGKKRKKNDGLDVDWGKMAVNLVGVALERADTRSWHLLPARISVARMELPAGRHTLTLDARGGAAQVALDAVDVRAGQTTFVTRRLWRGMEAARPSSAPPSPAPVALP